jgi:predicted metal-binding membrane protein
MVTAAPVRRPRRVPLVVPAAIIGAWALALAAQMGSRAALLHHDALLEGGPPLGAALGLFLLAWQVMVAAMMLPSTIPMLRLFAAASADQERPRAVLGAFIGGYAVVWTAFGTLALLFDGGVHHAVDATPWLGRRPWLVAGVVLAGAGLFQFSSLKDRCLDQCRHPGAYLLRHYRRGQAEAFRLGRGHGLFCLGCCWALMLLMFAAGVANLAWMAALTAVMVYEKAGRHGRRLTPVVGVTLLAWSVLVLAHPAWLPRALSGLT